jgi:hypothetical protein
VQTIIVDGLRWELDFAGFASSTRARSEAAELELRPWSCAQHLAALRQHLRMGAGGLELDGSGYADAVLANAEVIRRASEGVEPLLRSLALWWASGIVPGAPTSELKPDPEGWLDLGRDRAARLRAWTWGERLTAQRSHLHEAEPSKTDFDPLGYLDALLRACVDELVDRTTGERLAIEALDQGATRRLLAAVTALNHPDAASDPLALLSPALAAATLRLCAALGWTPERVLATPAVEVQRLLALLERVDAGRPAISAGPARARGPARRRRIADHPDAVVIMFDGPPKGGSS